ncbi:hypothetical protein LTR72_002538 [Exophiala xenobiotica]|nr:hypothetical protein LTR72_002538 [Exophiala xenobiotica]KAK5301906.1 hypothetical protein LTR14_000154 [Exophiala xenobiotica]KAK5405373.1 hypothetical protein LTR06_009071 [Exophiala xenobiotica]KAK5487712.1 hypothetical protein LTR55_005084 [Exophiala xenobiotica]
MADNDAPGPSDPIQELLEKLDKLVVGSSRPLSEASTQLESFKNTLADWTTRITPSTVQVVATMTTKLKMHDAAAATTCNELKALWNSVQSLMNDVTAEIDRYKEARATLQSKKEQLDSRYSERERALEARYSERERELQAQSRDVEDKQKQLLSHMQTLSTSSKLHQDAADFYKSQLHDMQSRNGQLRELLDGKSEEANQIFEQLATSQEKVLEQEGKLATSQEKILELEEKLKRATATRQMPAAPSSDFTIQESSTAAREPRGLTGLDVNPGMNDHVFGAPQSDPFALSRPSEPSQSFFEAFREAPSAPGYRSTSEATRATTAGLTSRSVTPEDLERSRVQHTERAAKRVRTGGLWGLNFGGRSEEEPKSPPQAGSVFRRKSTDALKALLNPKKRTADDRLTISTADDSRPATADTSDTGRAAAQGSITLVPRQWREPTNTTEYRIYRALRLPPDWNNDLNEALLKDIKRATGSKEATTRFIDTLDKEAGYSDFNPPRCLAAFVCRAPTSVDTNNVVTRCDHCANHGGGHLCWTVSAFTGTGFNRTPKVKGKKAKDEMMDFETSLNGERWVVFVRPARPEQ